MNAQDSQHVVGPRRSHVHIIVAALFGKGTGDSVNSEVCARAVALEGHLGEHVCMVIVPVYADVPFGAFLGVGQWNVGWPAIEEGQGVVYCHL